MLSFDAENVWDGRFPGDIRLAVHRLAKKGVTAFIVGPAVRDAWMNGSMDKMQRVDIIAIARKAHDVDDALEGVATSTVFFSRPEKLKRGSRFLVHDAKSGATIRKLQIMAVPEESGVLDQLSRREVTVNALAMNIDGQLLDPYGGLQDLMHRRLRLITPVQTAFLHKPVNLVKMAKHVAYHGFAPSEESVEYARRSASSILDVQIERVRPELERMLVNLHPDLGLEFLQETGVLNYLLPEVQAMVGFADSCRVHHKDIWDHTKKVVARSKPNPAIRWAALLHDVGKVWTRTVDDKGRVHFFRHEEMSAYLFTGIGARFRLEDRLADRIHYLVLNHSRINMYTDEWTDSAIRRLIRDTGEHLSDLISISRADITSRQERRVAQLTRLLDELEARITSVEEMDSKEPVLAKGAGNAIMQFFGLPPSPVVGQLRDALEDAIERGELPAGLEMEAYMGYLKELIRKEGQK